MTIRYYDNVSACFTWPAIHLFEEFRTSRDTRDTRNTRDTFKAVLNRAKLPFLKAFQAREALEIRSMAFTTAPNEPLPRESPKSYLATDLGPRF